jgi:uncharacterized OB-fold protein
MAGWFTLDPDQPTLLGSRCQQCGTLAFPKAATFCGNPACSGQEFDEVPLSRRGRIWSFTDARYQPPPPFLPRTDPFEPFAIAAVELEAEKLVVLGQVVPGVSVDDLRVGQEVELTLGTLYSEDGTDYLVWQWQPVQSGANA